MVKHEDGGLTFVAGLQLVGLIKRQMEQPRELFERVPICSLGDWLVNFAWCIVLTRLFPFQQRRPGHATYTCNFIMIQPLQSNQKSPTPALPLCCGGVSVETCGSAKSGPSRPPHHCQSTRLACSGAEVIGRDPACLNLISSTCLASRGSKSNI